MVCSKCGLAIPSGLTACRTPVEFSSRDQERMGVDIRARVLWGEPLEEIQADWRKKGAPEAEIRAALNLAIQERRSHFRMRGTQDLAVGIALFLFAAISYGFHWAANHGGLVLPRKTIAGIAVTAILLPLAGLFLSIRGIRRMAVGGEVKEAASDLNELE
jgi:hypothetical protein